MDWEPEQIETIYTMLVDNKSAAKIAKKVGRSRNAVLGKIHRDERLKHVAGARNLSTRNSLAKYKPGKHPNSQVPKVKGNDASIPLPEPTDTVPWVGRPMVRLDAGQCLWSVNTAEVGELHLFCGDASSGHPRYCARHAAMSQKIVPRKPTGKDHRDYIVNRKRKV